MFSIISHCNNFHKGRCMIYLKLAILKIHRAPTMFKKILVRVYLLQGGWTTASWEQEIDLLLKSPCTKYKKQK